MREITQADVSTEETTNDDVETVAELSLTEETQSVIADRVSRSQNGGSNGGDI